MVGLIHDTMTGVTAARLGKRLGLLAPLPRHFGRVGDHSPHSQDAQRREEGTESGKTARIWDSFLGWLNHRSRLEPLAHGSA